MARIKSYTDIEQSKKLAEILPIESADMYYHYTTSVVKNYYEDIPTYISLINHFAFLPDDIPCWSLAALLSVLSYPFLSELSNGIWKCGCYPSGICNYVTADSPIDACVAMIEKLHELKML